MKNIILTGMPDAGKSPVVRQIRYAVELTIEKKI